MRTSEQQQLDEKIEGWGWVVREMERISAAFRAERERLLGPDRGM